jgi:hypothetical protein
MIALALVTAALLYLSPSNQMGQVWMILAVATAGLYLTIRRIVRAMILGARQEQWPSLYEHLRATSSYLHPQPAPKPMLVRYADGSTSRWALWDDEPAPEHRRAGLERQRALEAASLR